MSYLDIIIEPLSQAECVLSEHAHVELCLAKVTQHVRCRVL